MLGWIEFTNSAVDDLHGEVVWSKPPLPAAAFYPAGFTIRGEATGSRYVPPVGSTNLVVSFTNGVVSFSGGNLETPFTNVVALIRGNQALNLSSNLLTMSILTRSGLITGDVTAPDGTSPMSFTAVLHQKADFGSGFIVGTNQTGLVRFSATGND